MELSLSLPNGGPWGDAGTLAGLAQLAEDLGWNGVFLEDYIVWQSDQSVPTYDPWVALAAIAMQTKHIRLGMHATALARRRPWKVAREAVTKGSNVFASPPPITAHPHLDRRRVPS